MDIRCIKSCSTKQFWSFSIQRLQYLWLLTEDITFGRENAAFQTIDQTVYKLCQWNSIFWINVLVNNVRCLVRMKKSVCIEIFEKQFCSLLWYRLTCFDLNLQHRNSGKLYISSWHLWFIYCHMAPMKQISISLYCLVYLRKQRIQGREHYYGSVIRKWLGYCTVSCSLHLIYVILCGHILPYNLLALGLFNAEWQMISEIV